MLNFLEKLDYLITAKNSRKEDASFHFGYIYTLGAGHHGINLCKMKDALCLFVVMGGFLIVLDGKKF